MSSPNQNQPKDDQLSKNLTNVTTQHQLNQLERLKVIQQLQKPVPQTFISQRPGGGGTTVDYVEGSYVIDAANMVFKFDGWMSQIIHLSEDFVCFYIYIFVYISIALL